MIKGRERIVGTLYSSMRAFMKAAEARLVWPVFLGRAASTARARSM